MPRKTKRMSRLTSAATNGGVRPHPELERDCAESQSQQLSDCCGWSATQPRSGTENTAHFAPDFLIWQLCDSAFPTGGFAHSGGLEAAAHNGEIGNRSELREWLHASLRQIGRTALPLVNAAHADPPRLLELDGLCDAFTNNHVANRASRLQGRAFLLAAERIFGVRLDGEDSELKGHLAPAYGAVLRRLNIDACTTRRLFVFQHLRGVIASAVRLNLVGPMEGQVIQRELSAEAESVAAGAAEFDLSDLAQTSPLLDLWQGTQDRLYSRLFQS